MSMTYGVGLDTTVDKLNLEIRFLLTHKYGPSGLRRLGQIIKECDLDNNGWLCPYEFELALNRIGVFFKKHEATALFLYYDKNGDGQLDYQEFLQSFRETLNNRRLGLVKKVYNSLDFKRSGKVPKEDAAVFYRPEVNRDYVHGGLSAEQALNEFWSHFQTNEDGTLSSEQFTHYYTDISSVVGSDENFATIMRLTWGILEDETPAPEPIILKYVNLLREKLINKTNGVLDEYLLAGMYRDYNTNKSGFLSKTELAAMAIRQNVDMPNCVLDGLFNKFSSGRLNYVDFEEFNNFILFDTYK